jgi:hypothetical protein
MDISEIPQAIEFTKTYETPIIDMIILGVPLAILSVIMLKEKFTKGDK